MSKEGEIMRRRPEARHSRLSLGERFYGAHVYQLCHSQYILGNLISRKLCSLFGVAYCGYGRRDEIVMGMKNDSGIGKA